MIDELAESGPSQTDQMVEQTIAKLYEKSKYSHHERGDGVTDIEREGKKYTVQQIEDSEDEDVEKLQDILLATFDPEEVDSLEVQKAAIDGKTPDGSPDLAKYKIFTVKNEQGEIVSFYAGGHMDIPDSNKTFYAVAYTVTAPEYKNQGLAREAYLASISDCAKEASSRNKVFTYAIGEVVEESEGFVNTLNRKRLYVEDKSDPKHLKEVPYYQPALDYDLETGEVEEGAGDVGEHLMVGRMDGKDIEKNDIVDCVDMTYQWITNTPEEEFSSPGAYFIHRKHVKDLLDEYKQFLKSNRKLVPLSADERKQKREDGYTVDDFTPEAEE